MDADLERAIRAGVIEALAEARYRDPRPAVKGADVMGWYLGQLRQHRDYLKVLAASMDVDVSVALKALDEAISAARLRLVSPS